MVRRLQIIQKILFGEQLISQTHFIPRQDQRVNLEQEN